MSIKTLSLIERLCMAVLAAVALIACAKSEEEPDGTSASSSGSAPTESPIQNDSSSVYKQQSQVFSLVEATVSSPACRYMGAIAPGSISLKQGEVSSSFNVDPLRFLERRFSSIFSERTRINGEISEERLVSFYNEDANSNLSSMKQLEYKANADHAVSLTSSVAQGEGEMSCMETKSGPTWFGLGGGSAYQDVFLALVRQLPAHVSCSSVASGDSNVDLEFGFGAGAMRLGDKVGNVEAKMNSIERLIISPEEDPRQRGLVYSFAEEQGSTWTLGLDNVGKLVQLSLLPTVGAQQVADYGYICNVK